MMIDPSQLGNCAVLQTSEAFFGPPASSSLTGLGRRLSAFNEVSDPCEKPDMQLLGLAIIGLAAFAVTSYTVIKMH